MPTLLLHGEKDVALGEKLLTGVEAAFDPAGGGVEVKMLKDCSHWVQQVGHRKTLRGVRRRGHGIKRFMTILFPDQAESRQSGRRLGLLSAITHGLSRPCTHDAPPLGALFNPLFP
jgi:hypothetical protein